jgi:hypothetical protein
MPIGLFVEPTGDHSIMQAVFPKDQCQVSYYQSLIPSPRLFLFCGVSVFRFLWYLVADPVHEDNVLVY